MKKTNNKKQKPVVKAKKVEKKKVVVKKPAPKKAPVKPVKTGPLVPPPARSSRAPGWRPACRSC